ncbi:MAG: MarR family winged helix-turn-helix transcriptional regulator [Microthrixaceae bacterium]
MSTRPLGQADYRALAEFRRQLRVFLRFSEDAARSQGITPAQHQLLLAVKGWSEDEAPSVSDVAGHLLLRTHSAVELVGRATEAGLVRTTEDPADHRRHLVELTAEGEQILAALSRLHRDELRSFRSDLHEVLAAL